MVFGSSCRQRVRDCDATPIPVGITYKGQKEFNTVFGGCLTIILFLLVASFGLQDYISLYSNPIYYQSNAVSYTQVQDINTLKMSTNSTNIVLRLNQSVFEETISSDWVNQAARIQFYQTSKQANGTITTDWLNATLCSEFYKGTSLEDNIEIAQQPWVCPDIE